MKRLLSVFLMLHLLIAGGIHAQRAGENFGDISRRMNAYYDSAGKNASGYKQWKRWEWYYSTRTGDNGIMVNNDELNRRALQTSIANRAAAPAFTLANTGAWRSLGPSSVNSDDRGIGRVNRIAFHPTNENTMYVASATGGLWITTDGGANWYSYSEGIPNMSLSGVVVDYTNTNIIYILTGDADAAFGAARGQFSYGKTSIGVLKSYDGGFTWYRTGLRWSETDNMNAYKMVIHPSSPNILMVATNKGIYRTADGGATWDSTDTNRDFYDIEFHPTNPAIVYASGTYFDDIIVMKSTNAGISFAQAHAISREDNYKDKRTLNRSSLAVSPANSNIVYLLAGPCTAAGSFQGIYRSTDAGESFTLRTNTPNILGRSATGSDATDQHNYDLSVVASPSNINRVACGGIKLWTSTNGGSSFAFQDDYVSSLSYYHVDIHDMMYHPLNSNKLYMCGDGGVYLSLDNGDNWVSVSGNLGVTQYYKIAANPGVGFGVENVLIGGTQDNGTNKRGVNGGSNFSKVLGADGMDCLIDPDNLNTYIASTQDGVFYFSGNAGSSFGLIGNPETIGSFINRTVESRWVTPVAEVAGSNTQFVLGYFPAVLATNIGSGWIFADLGTPGGTFVKTARNNANRMFAGDNNFLDEKNFIETSTDKGNNWTTVLNESNTTRITDLTFDPTNGNRIWITYGGYNSSKKVRFTNNGGSTWTDVNGSLPNVPVNCILYDGSPGAAPDAIYIGTDIGVFYKDNNLGDWIPFSNRLPVVEVTDLEMHPTLGLLRAGTYGRGIWETSRYSGCAGTINLDATNTAVFSPYYHQASLTINSTAQHHGAGANVFYKAGTEISLAPGFAASAYGENVFEASIGPCGGGVPSRPAMTSAQRVRGVLLD